MDTNFETWLQAARSGSPEGAGQLWESQRARLTGIARRCLPSATRAWISGSDVVQDVLLRAQDKLPTFRGQTQAEFVAWLRQILMHRIDDLRTQQKQRQARIERLRIQAPGRETTGVSESAGRHASSLFIQNEEEAAVREVLRKIPEDYATVIRLRQEDMTYAEIGAQMGKSADAARMLWVRAINLVREELRKRKP